jgi:hypothetical protein
MKANFLLIVVAFAVLLAQVCAQSLPEQKPGEAELAAYRRRFEILLHPTGIITIRLAAEGREPSTTPPPYSADNWMHFQMFTSLTAGEELTYSYSRNRCYAYRPELIRDGDILSYSKEAQECVKRAERESGGDGFSQAPETLTPGREYLSHYVNLEDWYETPLRVGHYQLLVRKQFYYGGDWLESNPVTFDVVPRTLPTPIPATFTVRLILERQNGRPAGQLYKLGLNDGLVVELVNDSDRPVAVNVIDKYYGNRPQLTRDQKVIPYRDDIAKLIESKEKDGRLVEVVNPFFLDPKTTHRLDGFSLNQWYGPLVPGIYHLTARRRFEIGGAWTNDSPEFVFEISP